MLYFAKSFVTILYIILKNSKKATGSDILSDTSIVKYALLTYFLAVLKGA